MDIILCSDHLTLVLAVWSSTRHLIYNLPNLHFHICKYKCGKKWERHRGYPGVPLAPSAWKLHSEGGLLQVRKRPDCRALPTLLCPENLQDFVVRGFLELIQCDSLHDKWSTHCYTQSLFQVPTCEA